MGSVSELIRRHFVVSPPAMARFSPLTDATEEEAFVAHCLLHLGLTSRISAAICLAVTLAWWPLDLLIYGFADIQRPPEVFRWIIGGVCAAYLLLPRTPRLLRHGFWLVSAVLVCIMAAISQTAGRLGGLGAPWFHLAYPLISVSVIFPLSLSRRVAMVAMQTLGFIGGLFLFHPENLGSPYLLMTLSMLVLVSSVSIAFGHYVHLLFRENFRQARSLARNAAELEARVTEKTHALRELLAYLERAREEERIRISRELHDELGQELTALRYAQGLTLSRFQKDPTAIEKNLIEIGNLLQRTTGTVRGLVAQLRPPVLDDLGLAEATRWLAQQTGERAGLICTTAISGDYTRLPPDLASAAFRILQESLTNAIRHARATRIEISLSVSAEQLELHVQDDGVGFNPESVRSGMGLLGMRERALALGTRLILRSSPGGGTRLACTIPLPRPPADTDAA
jgi:signal transduction histidine kinase